MAHRSTLYPRLPHESLMTGYASSILHYSGTSSCLLCSRRSDSLITLVTTAVAGIRDVNGVDLAINNGHMGTSVQYHGQRLTDVEIMYKKGARSASMFDIPQHTFAQQPPCTGHLPSLRSRSSEPSALSRLVRERQRRTQR